MPHIDKVIASSVDAINAGIRETKTGRTPVGKIVVQIDRSPGLR